MSEYHAIIADEELEVDLCSKLDKSIVECRVIRTEAVDANVLEIGGFICRGFLCIIVNAEA